MNLPDGLLPPDWLWSGHALYGLLLLTVLWQAPWQRLLQEGQALNLFLGTSVALMALWSLKAGVLPGLNFHFLGASLLTLMFGWPLAVVAMSIVLLAVTLNGMSGWETFSVNALLMGALPAAVTWGVFRLADQYLPRHLFIYIFVCGFFAAALAMAATGLASTAVFALSGTYSLDHLLQHYLPYYLLMMFPEAIFTGSFVALLVVYRPSWIWTYDEDEYLGR
jgi:uncharacterized membrane protein